MSGGNKKVHMVTFLLLIVGGLNWLVVGIFDLNVVAYLGPTLANVVYVLVGLSAIYELVTHKATCKMCGMKDASSSSGNSGQMNGVGGQ